MFFAVLGLEQRLVTLIGWTAGTSHTGIHLKLQKPFTVLFCKMHFANSLFFLEMPEEPGRLQSIGLQRAKQMKWLSTCASGQTHAIFLLSMDYRGFPGGASGEESAYQCRRHRRCRRWGFNSWVRKLCWRRKWQPTAVFLPGASPWTEDPDRVQSTVSQWVGHDWVTK